jgi:hypothetical protein
MNQTLEIYDALRAAGDRRPELLDEVERLKPWPRLVDGRVLVAA